MINNSLYLEEIPKLHPLSLEYKEFWKQIKKECIEGRWVGGKWMPGNLFFYINLWSIWLNKTAKSKTKVVDRPKLFDIFWDVAYYWIEARGFSGFELDDEFTCNRDYAEIGEDDFGKKYVSAREYLPKIHKGNLGCPLFENDARNLMWMANRGPGKSYWAAGGVIGHEFLFDGAKRYTLGERLPAAEILVGAGNAQYSTDLLMKVKLGFTELMSLGAMEINGRYYPNPLYKRTSGTWSPGKKGIMHSYKKKIGGTWVPAGTGSIIKHKTYKDNPFAGQGTRPSVVVKEEIGMFDNLKASHEADVETQQFGTVKFGSTLFMGTGGDMDGGTDDASEMFNDPETFDCLVFEDEWEHRGKIGYFLPAYQGKLQFKDDNGNTLEKAAKLYETEKREKLRKGKNASTALDAYIQYNPMVPSEMFLRKTGNIFPKAELNAWLAELENNPKYEDSEFVGDVIHDADGNTVFIPDVKNKLKPIRKFPINPAKEDVEGCVVIWEHPYRDGAGNVPFGLYVAGTDPYDHDESGTPSLGSTFIYKRFISKDQWYECPVAEYTGRPKANEYYKRLVLLLQYYNARCLYENEKKGLHQYAASKGYDYLLMDQPGYIKDVIPNSSVNRIKGMHMNAALKTHGEVLIKNWLEDEYAPGRLNLTKIRSIPLLKELIAYNRDGNFDRVMGFMCAMYAIQERERLVVTQEVHYKDIHDSDFFNRKKFLKSSILK